MKYTIDLEIDLPRERVIELFDSTGNLTKWQPDLLSFEHQSGEAGQVGAKSRLVYKMGKRDCEMIETITKRNLPDEFCGTYEAKGMWNQVENRFSEPGPGKTLWSCTSEFIGSNLMMKAMLFLMPGMFRKETAKFMNQFKAFAESEGRS